MTAHRILAAGIAGLFAAPWASAQGNVTLYGIVDLAARSVNNQGVGSMPSLVSGSTSTSRIGLRGIEDLGGGLSVGFNLEHGLLADSGTQASSTKFWDRRSTVSLISKALGEVRLGRDFVPTYRNWSRYDPFAYVGVARTADFFTGTPIGPIRSVFGSNDNSLVRSDNAIQYLLPKLGGLEGEVMVAAAEGGSAAQGNARLIGARLGYATKAFGVSAATSTVENALTTDGKFKDTAIGGNLEIGDVELSAAWRQLKYSAARQSHWLVGATYSFGLHLVRASWQRVDLSGRVGSTDISANDASKLGLGYVYNLSKRSALYATAARISNDGGARYTIPGGPAGLAAGKSSTGYEAGLIHRF
ncbi:MAG: porin [Caldimonas sp.]